MPFIRKIQNFLALPGARKFMFFEAWLVLSLSWLAIRVIPFRRLCRLFGKHMVSTPETDDVSHRETLKDTLWAINKAARFFPVEMNCFPRAIAGKLMLKRRGIPSTLYLGVTRDKESSGLKAHAWLRSGATTVTGHMENPDEFGVVAYFG